MTDILVTETVEIFTENGARSYAATSARVNMFFHWMRNCSEERTKELLIASFAEDPLDTLKCIFYTRDVRGGKGERKIFTQALTWLAHAHPTVLKENLAHIPHFGRWKDLLTLFGTPVEKEMIALYCAQLRTDLALLKEMETETKAMETEKVEETKAMETEKVEETKAMETEKVGETKEVEKVEETKEKKKSISLAGKFAPSAKSKYNKSHGAVKLFCKELGINEATYRKQYLVPLHQKLALLETAMSSRQWEQINFEHVPSQAGKMYAKAFAKRCGEKYSAYLKAVQEGKAKANVGTLMPHEIVGMLGNLPDGIGENATAEVLWKVFLETQQKKLIAKGFQNALAIVDVSKSMEGIPIAVSLSLGLFISLTNIGPFANKFITFSAKPQLQTITGETLAEKLRSMVKCEWDMNTNIQAAFDLILDSAKLFNVPAEQMPETLFILSDMQFDQATFSGEYAKSDGCTEKKTNWEVLKEKYAKANYKLPKVIFWNLRSGLDIPAPDDTTNVALLSGFSTNLLNLVLDQEPIDPYRIYRKAIDNPRYERITYNKEVDVVDGVKTMLLEAREIFLEVVSALEEKRYFFIASNPNDKLGYMGDGLKFFLVDLLGFVYPSSKPLGSHTGDLQRRYFILPEPQLTTVLKKEKEEFTDSSESEELSTAEEQWANENKISAIVAEFDWCPSYLHKVEEIESLVLEALEEHNTFLKKHLRSKDIIGVQQVEKSLFRYFDSTTVDESAKGVTCNLYQLLHHMIMFPPGRHSPLLLFA